MSVYSTLFGDPNAGLSKSRDTLRDGYGKANTALDAGEAESRRILGQGQAGAGMVQGMGSADSRLAMADQFRQDANRYEQDRATQGALSAYGDDPLSGGARSQVTAQLAQLARQNYGSALDRANAATNNNMGIASQDNNNIMNQGLSNNLQYTQGRSELATGLANSLASSQQAERDQGGVLGKIGHVVSGIFG